MTARVILMLLLCSLSAHAGGPMLVSNTGQPFIWDPSAMPIAYRVDGGAMSRTAAGVTVVDNAAGIARVAAVFQYWAAVPTAAVAFNHAGPILPVAGFSDGNVDTAAEFDAVESSCESGAQSPIVFDADGAILNDLGLDPGIIGFSGICALNGIRIAGALILMNGTFQDGVSPYQLTPAQFDEAMAHEMGHFLGLGHAQINLYAYLNNLSGYCSADDLAGLPLMFPVMFCQSRPESGLPPLSADDAAWISQLYPAPAFAGSYGVISGQVFFSDGVTPVQGVNVIARLADDPNTPDDESRRTAVSSVSGYRFTGNPGQSITANYLPCAGPGCPASGFYDDNSGGDPYGSRDLALIGTFDLPLPPGNYRLEVESVYGSFTFESGVGPLLIPTALPGIADIAGPITVAPGQTVNNVNIILKGTPPRFDQFEDPGVELRVPLSRGEALV